jgi:hypothetical protein
MKLAGQRIDRHVPVQAVQEGKLTRKIYVATAIESTTAAVTAAFERTKSYETTLRSPALLKRNVGSTRVSTWGYPTLW